MMCQRGGVVIFALLRSEELVRDRERRKHGDAIEIGRARAGADLAHLAVEEACRGDEPRTLFGRAGNQILAIENRDRYGFSHDGCDRRRSPRPVLGFEEAGIRDCAIRRDLAGSPLSKELCSFARYPCWFCSSDFKRRIIASTRERACSLRASSCARSVASCSWLWRRLRFSSCSVRHSSSSRSTRSPIETSVCSCADMAANIASRFVWKRSVLSHKKDENRWPVARSRQAVQRMRSGSRWPAPGYALPRFSERDAPPDRPIAKKAQALLGRERQRKPMPLNLVATLLPQIFDLLGALDAFGDHVETERMRHRDDGCRDRLVVGIG